MRRFVPELRNQSAGRAGVPEDELDAYLTRLKSPVSILTVMTAPPIVGENCENKGKHPS